MRDRTVWHNRAAQARFVPGVAGDRRRLPTALRPALPVPGQERVMTVKAMFVAMLVLIGAGLAYFATLGLMQR